MSITQKQVAISQFWAHFQPFRSLKSSILCESNTFSSKEKIPESVYNSSVRSFFENFCRRSSGNSSMGLFGVFFDSFYECSSMCSKISPVFFSLIPLGALSINYSSILLIVLAKAPSANSSTDPSYIFPRYSSSNHSEISEKVPSIVP